MGTVAEPKKTYTVADVPAKITARTATESPAPIWESIGARKRADLRESIPQEWRVPADLLPPDSQIGRAHV